MSILDIVPTVIGAGVTIKIADTFLDRKGGEDMKRHKKGKHRSKDFSGIKDQYVKGITKMKSKGYAEFRKLRKVGV